MSTPSGVIRATKTFWGPEGAYHVAYLEKLSTTTWLYSPMLAADVTSITYTIYLDGVQNSTGSIPTSKVFTPAVTSADILDDNDNPMTINFGYLFGVASFPSLGTYKIDVLCTLTSGEKLHVEGEAIQRGVTT